MDKPRTRKPIERKSWKVNSVESLNGFIEKVKGLLPDHKQINFTWTYGKKDRSKEQNKMIYAIYNAVAMQIYGNDERDVRRECKLNYGIPILRSVGHDMTIYDKVSFYCDYEEKKELMDWIDVTSIFKVKQCQTYIDRLWNDYTLAGVDFSQIDSDLKGW